MDCGLSVPGLGRIGGGGGVGKLAFADGSGDDL